MGQVTIYLDNDTEKKLTEIVKHSGKSKSRWIADLIREKAHTSWPEHVQSLAGAWDDFPSAEQIRADMGTDLDREEI